MIIVEQNARPGLRYPQGVRAECGKDTDGGRGQKLLDDPRIQEAYLGFK